MNYFRTIFEETIGLFVDDGRFAGAILIWIVFAVLVLPHWSSNWTGVAFFVGLALILLFGALFGAKKGKPPHG